MFNASKIEKVNEFLTEEKFGILEKGNDFYIDDISKKADEGLAGRGTLPMIPCYISSEIDVPENAECSVLDVGGTNCRSAHAKLSKDGEWFFYNFVNKSVPGKNHEISRRAFFSELSENISSSERVGFGFSFNTKMQRNLDGIIRSFSKNVMCSEAEGTSLAQGLEEALGRKLKVTVVNDTTVTYLGGKKKLEAMGCSTVIGMVLGTGMNICYAEYLSKIEKLEENLRTLPGKMLINTESAEYSGFSKSLIDEDFVADSLVPALAPAEKQISGAYIGPLIAYAWLHAAKAGLLPNFKMTKKEALKVDSADVSIMLDEAGIFTSSEDLSFLQKQGLTKADAAQSDKNGSAVLKTVSESQEILAKA